MLKGDRVTLRAVEREDLKRLHEQLFFNGRYVDSVFMGLLRREWQTRRGESA